MRLASKEEFSIAYTDYRWHEGYARRARLFRFFPEPILVVGCGFGFLVQEFENAGKLAWGMDASPYAIENRVSKRAVLGDVFSLSDYHMGQFGTLITEDMLPWLTDDEALVAARNCQAISPIVIHLVTEHGQADYNYHSTGYWMTLTGQLTISLEGM